MRKIPKTITLDEQTAIIAERIGNFFRVGEAKTTHTCDGSST